MFLVLYVQENEIALIFLQSNLYIFFSYDLTLLHKKRFLLLTMFNFMTLFLQILHIDAIRISSWKVPTWNTTTPNFTVNASGGLPPINSIHFMIFNHSLANNGTYNNGPIPIIWNNNFYVSWYNTQTGKESNDMRVLYSTSPDSKTWSKPMEAFPNLTHVGEENEPWLIINNRLYCSASMYNYPFQALMRQITGPSSTDKKGEMFWLTDEVPPGLERKCNLTFLDMDNQTKSDMQQYIASLIKTETFPGGELDDVFFNERSLYLIPNTTNDKHQQLMLLLRTNDKNNGNRLYQWASTCINNLKYKIIANDALNNCRPGIGVLKWNLVNIVDGKSQTVHELERCNWTKPVKTNIYNAPARTCAATLSDGRIYFIGNILWDNGMENRQVQVLAISNDGFQFTSAWAYRYNENGLHNSFEYPAAVWDETYLYITDSINKNDIEMSIIKLTDII
eukprot:504276_1